MNKLSQGKQSLILSQLVEGNSIRSIERMTGVHRDTIMRLLLRAGENAEFLHDERVRNLTVEQIQCDELWTFVGCKQRHLTQDERDGERVSERGDQWVFVAIDAYSKLVPSYMVGKRDWGTASRFIHDLSDRVTGYFQLSSDSLRLYSQIVPLVLGDRIEYGQVHKSYGEERKEQKRYSPAYMVRVTIRSIIGEPNPKEISTSYIERQNLTMRMSMRRFTRLTNAFSKKLENLRAAVALHFYHYNFMREHSSLLMTPAMAAGLTNEAWGWEPILS
jgi:IS1 family transposase